MSKNNQFPLPRAILFDWDNTLVDTWPLIHGALVETFESMGQTPWTLDEVKSKVAKSLRDSFPALFHERWEEAAKIYQDAYLARHLKNLQAMPEAARLLEALHKRVKFLGIVSNKKGPSLRLELKHLGWDRYFDAAIGSQDAEHDKPHPAPVYLALKGTGIEPGPDVWFVGDSAVDIECAVASGCLPVLYGHHPEAVAALEKHSHGRHAHDHIMLEEWLRAAFV
ncbi:MAG: HAD family hydrolase [Alphaproteobacteria bacterium]|nr:HAD family hydrolase [Alphaproteobacteria bacterium]